MKSTHRQFGSIARSGAAFLALAALLSGTFAIASSAQSARATKSRSNKAASTLNEDQRILHVLNRLGFGARPGDVARVKAMGLDNYINQQLNPQKISDTVADAKVKDLSTLTMTTAQLYEKFPQPALLLRQLEQRGELPAELAAARDNRVKGGANAAPGEAPANQSKSGNAGEMTAQAGDAKKDIANPNENANPLENPKYRQALREYYQQHGL